MKIELELTDAQIAAIVAAAQAPDSPAFKPTPTVPPGHVYLPTTGHILPLPDPKHVSFWGYMIENYAAAGGAVGLQSPMHASMAYNAQARAEGRAPEQLGRDSWPEALDRCYNVEKYETPTEKAQRLADEAAAAEAVWISTPSRRPDPAPAGNQTETL